MIHLASRQHQNCRKNEKFWANGPFGAVALAVESVPATSKEAEATIKATTNPTSSEVIEIIDDPIVQLKKNSHQGESRSFPTTFEGSVAVLRQPKDSQQQEEGKGSCEC